MPTENQPIQIQIDVDERLMRDPRAREAALTLLQLRVEQAMEDEQQEALARLAGTLAASVERTHSPIGEAIRAIPTFTPPKFPTIELPTLPTVRLSQVPTFKLREPITDALHPIAEMLRQIFAAVRQIAIAVTHPIAAAAPSQITADLHETITNVQDQINEGIRQMIAAAQNTPAVVGSTPAH